MHNNDSSALTHASDGRRYLDEGESLRGLAIALVVIFHLLIGLHGIDPQPQLPWYRSIWFAGNTGVTLFFVLSGFLLVQPFLSGQPYSIANFYWNRALRILPLYWLMVLAGGLYHQNLSAALSAAVFLDIDITTLPPFGPVWWSLAVEMQFYLLLPVVVWFLRRSPVWAWPFAAGAFIAAYYWVATAAPDAEIHNGRDSIVGRWPAFACGMAAAWLYARRDRLPGWSGRAGLLAGDALLVAPLVGLAVIADRIVSQYGILAHVYWYHHYALEALLWSLFLLALLTCPSHLKVLFNNPLLNRLGTWSYSAYLLHMPVFHFTMKLAEHLPAVWREQYLFVIVGFYLAATVICSALSYRYIELPFLRLKRPIRPAAATAGGPIAGTQ